MAGHIKPELTMAECGTVAAVLQDVDVLNAVSKKFSLGDADRCNKAGRKMQKEIKNKNIKKDNEDDNRKIEG